jgi:hypothetical protein
MTSVPLSPLHAFDGKKCARGAGEADWTDLSVSGALFATERDGDITLVTSGDGVFLRR